MNTKTLRNVFRWGGFALAALGYILDRSARTLTMFNIGRVLMGAGLVMIVAGIVVRLFIREP